MKENRFKSLWDKHISMVEEIKHFHMLKQAGYGKSRAQIDRAMKMVEMYYKEKKTMPQIAAHFKITHQAVQQTISRVAKPKL